MFKLSAFADEISDDLDVQIQTLLKNGVDNIELRGVWGKNVLALSQSEIVQVKRQASDHGIGFSAVGSPLGKYPLTGDIQSQIDDLRKALDYAAILEAPYIRIFSFYIPEGRTPESCRDQVMDWLGRLVDVAEETEIVLAHENERHIYGENGDRCMDIYQTIQSPNFTGLFDPANFVVCGEDSYACWQRMKQHISYFHIKDAVMGTGRIVPTGQGDGAIPQILKEAAAAGCSSFLTLEPHLSLAEANYGKTSPDLFATAATALKKVLADIHTA